jgi:hypothetical protein
MYDEKTGRKRMSVARLQELIKQVPDHAFIETNDVGNLAITNASQDFVGVIDFNEELVNWITGCHKILKQ